MWDRTRVIAANCFVVLCYWYHSAGRAEASSDVCTGTVNSTSTGGASQVSDVSPAKVLVGSFGWLPGSSAIRPGSLLNAQRRMLGAAAFAQSRSESLVSTVMRVALTSPTMWTSRLPHTRAWQIAIPRTPLKEASARWMPCRSPRQQHRGPWNWTTRCPRRTTRTLQFPVGLARSRRGMPTNAGTESKPVRGPSPSRLRFERTKSER